MPRSRRILRDLLSPGWNWMFRSRQTGQISIVESPNVLLSLWLATVVLRWTLRPSGVLADVVHVVGSGALVLWAVDELVRGLNPFRRALGVAVVCLEFVMIACALA